MTSIFRVLIRSMGLANILVYITIIWVAWGIPPLDYLLESAQESVPTLAAAEPRPTPVEPEAHNPHYPITPTVWQFPTRPTATPTLARPTPSSTVPSATATPLPPTPTPTPTATFVLLVAPTPPASGSQSYPPPLVPAVKLPPEVVNIVLLGSDRRGDGGSWRTDSIILVTVNASAKTVGLLSIPRDLWVYIPTYGYERINTADFRGQYSGYDNGNAALLKSTIQYNLGIPVHYYVRVHFQGFVKIIDTLGGVTVYVDCPINDLFPDPDSPTGFYRLSLTSGVHHLDGKAAFFFSRSRLSTSDFDRARRQQKVLTGLWEQSLQPKILTQIPRLWEVLKDTMETDLALEQILALAYLGTQLGPTRIKSRFIDSTMVRSWVTPGGAWVLLPDPPQISQTVAELLTPPKETVSWLVREGARIEVWNGTGRDGLAELAAARLRWQGFQVVDVGQAARVSHTTVIDYTGKGYTLSHLCKTLDIPPARIQQQFDPDSPVDIRVIMGPDFQPCKR